MKNFKYLLFLIPFLFLINVSAQNVTSSVRCSFNGSGSTYYGDPNDGLNSARCYNFGTRYSPRLGYIEFYLPTSVMSFTAGKSYTVTMNMATNDWRNNIMLQNVRYVSSNGSVITSSPLPSMTNFRFVSKKQIKFDFKLPTGTIYPYLRFVLSSPTYGNPDPDISSSTYMTGDTNWNLTSIDISPVSSSSGSSSGSGSSSSSFDDSGIINNNNQNTTDVINNNNQNTQDIIDNQKDLLANCVKNLIPRNYVSLSSRPYNYSISLIPGEFYTISSNAGIGACIHNGDFNCINELNFNDYGNNPSYHTFIAQSNSNYISFTNGYGWGNYDVTYSETLLALGSSVASFVPYGQEKCVSKIDDTNKAINDVNNSINNSNVDNNVGTGFFDDFTSQDFGLSQIITIPLNTIQSLTSKTCVPLQVPIPFTNSNITLPCMTEIYETKFPSIYNLWKIVSFGIVAYFIAIDIFRIVKGFKDPESDKVEVLDL